MIRLIGKYTKKWAILATILAPLAMFLEVYMDLMQPKLLADVVDIGIVNRDLDLVFRLGGKMIMAALVGAIGGSLCSFFAAYASVHMAAELRLNLFRKIQSLSFKELDRLRTSSLITRMTNDITQVQNMFAMSIRGAVRAPLLLFGGLIMAIQTSQDLTVIFVLAIPMILMAAFFVIRNSYKRFRVVQESLDRMNRIMRESVVGIRVIKALTMEDKQKRKFREVNERLKDWTIKAQDMNMLLSPIVTLILNVSVVAVLWFGGVLVMDGQLEVGKIMAFTNYLLQMLNALIMLVSMVVGITRAQASATRIHEVFEEEASVVYQVEGTKITIPSVTFHKVSFRYHQHGEAVLKELDFTIEAGEKVGIIGPTGSGKSTLVQLINRFYDATEGEILLGGVDIKELSKETIIKEIAMVMQNPTLFSGTVEENLRFGDQDAEEGKMLTVLEEAQALNFINEERSLQSRVEQRGKNFSGGQKQRLSIARALMKEPSILILDDASSALDMETEAQLMKNIGRLEKKMTLILVAQRISSILHMDKIIVMNEGAIEAIGRHEELLKISPVYQSIVISQFGKELA